MAAGRQPDGSYRVEVGSCSPDGFDAMVWHARLLERHLEGLEAWRSTRSAICAAHRLVVVRGEWLVNDYDERLSETFVPFLFLGQHNSPAPSEWCCIEMFAVGLPGGLICEAPW